MKTFLNLNQDFSSYFDLNFILKLVLLYFTALWIALIIWVTRDAINRSNNLLFQIFSILLNIFLPVFGLVIYLVIRPTRTLLECYYEDLEYRALVENGEEKEICQKCKTEVSREYDFCPNCGDKLRQTCQHCQKEFSKRWKICPYCGEKVIKRQKKKEVKTEKQK